MKVKIGSDGGNHCTATIIGMLSADLPKPEPVLFFSRLSGAPKRLRIDSLQFSIQEKMGFILWWLMGEVGPTGTVQPLELIMPLESRGGYDLEKAQPISSPDGAVGIALTSFKVTEKNMSFFIVLDLTKQ